MSFFKNVWNKIKAPKPWVIALCFVMFAMVLTGTILLIVLLPKQGVFHFIMYGISAILLSYVVYLIIYIAPFFKAKIVEILRRYKFTNSILNSYGYRTLVFSVVSFIFNMAYVIFLAVFAFKTMSAWYISITAYYLVLILMKGNIYYSKYKYNTPIKQARAYRLCGIMFILLPIAFSGIIVLIYTTNMFFEYAGLMIYAVATYTFYRLILAIINIFKAKKQDDLYIQSIRNVNLASALISVVVLQVALFQAFSPESNLSVANALTGAGVSLIIFAFGIVMIVVANLKLKKLKTEKIDVANEEE